MDKPRDPYLDEAFQGLVSKFLEFFQQPAPRASTTFVFDVLQAFLEKSTNIPDSTAAAIWRMFDSAKFPEQDEILKPYEKDPRTLELMALIDQADAKVDMAFMEYVADFLISPDTFGHMVSTGETLGEAKKLNGEPRARKVIQAIDSVAELLYQPFLVRVRALHLCSQGRAVTPAPTFGMLVNELAANMPGSLLVDPDAGWLRNSAEHGRWRYLPPSNSLLMWDLKHPEQLFKVDEIMERAWGWHKLSISILQRLYRLNTKKHWPRIWAELKPLIKAEAASKE
jgi:hypothetical protein